ASRGLCGLHPPAFPIVREMKTLLYSCLTRSLSEAASSVAASMIAAIAIKPAENEPVQSLSQPIMLGPTKPPNTPMVLMKANPPAAPMPVKSRVGTFQKMARAEVTPTSAMVKPASATSSEPVSTTDATKPTAPRKQATARLATFLPVRSICQAQGADLHREPGGEIVGDADEVARFGGAQQQACGIKAAGSDDEGGRGRDNAPGNHDAREPPPRADAVEHQVARDFEQAIGDEQEAGAQAELA